MVLHGRCATAEPLVSSVQNFNKQFCMKMIESYSLLLTAGQIQTF